VAGIVALLLGIVACAAGAGLGIRYGQKIGASATTVIGFILLAAGIALLSAAVVVFWRAASGWRRLWFVPGTVVTLLLVWSIALGVMLSTVPRVRLGTVTPLASGLAYSDVTFPAADGATLSAWLVPSRNSAAVVLLHGAGSNRTATLPQAVVLARHGFGVLLVDAHGEGRSGGSGMDAGWYGDEDVRGAVRFLGRQPGIDPTRIAVLGLSMGGEEAIGAAASGAPIAAVVAEGATGRTDEDRSGWLPGGINGAVQRGTDWVTYHVAGLLTAAPRPRPLHDAIARTGPTHFLLIAAGGVADETRAARYFRSAAPARVQVWTVPGAGHTHGITTEPAEWESRVVSFLSRSLRV
jgi:dienelactone hydrolase